MFKKALELLGFGRAQLIEEDDRRIWGRMKCDLETTCRQASDPDAPWHPVRVRNISNGGIGIQIGRSFALGSLLSIALPGNDVLDPATEVLACVVRCDAGEEPGRFEMGCTFAGVLSDSDLARFGARHARSAPADKRHWVRYPITARARYQVIRTPMPSDVVEATVLDLSAGGLALQVDSTLCVGDLLNLDLCLGEDLLLTTLASVVRTEHDHEGKHFVGCNFIREISDELIDRLRVSASQSS